MRARLWIVLAATAIVAGAVLGLATLVPFDLRDTRVQQALIAGTVVALGWVVGFTLREVSAHLGRVERLRDVHRALFAEIMHNLQNLGSADDLRSYGQDMIDRIGGGEGFTPFIARERNDTVFQSIVADLHILPRVTIDPIVQYYSQIAALDALIEDLRSDAFRALPPQRRADVYADYIAVKINLVEYGQEATEVIDAYARSRQSARKLSKAFREKRNVVPSAPAKDQ